HIGPPIRRTRGPPLVPYSTLFRPSADATEPGERPLFDAALAERQPLVREVRRGCLPMGRYAISLVYPTGQAWTVPNESGGCAPRSEEHTSELQSREKLVCRRLLEQ